MAEEPTLTEKIDDMLKNTHAMIALTWAAFVANKLQTFLEGRMPHLNHQLKKKFFSAYGPFHSFSVQIDVCYAMGMIPRELWTLLHNMRDIRNKFAHPDGPTTFDSEIMDKLFPKFLDFKKGEDRLRFFARKSQGALSEIVRLGETDLLIKAIKAHSAKQKASP
jgi:hypothetical protein